MDVYTISFVIACNKTLLSKLQPEQRTAAGIDQLQTQRVYVLMTFSGQWFAGC